MLYRRDQNGTALACRDVAKSAATANARTSRAANRRFRDFMRFPPSKGGKACSRLPPKRFDCRGWKRFYARRGRNLGAPLHTSRAKGRGAGRRRENGGGASDGPMTRTGLSPPGGES